MINQVKVDGSKRASDFSNTAVKIVLPFKLFCEINFKTKLYKALTTGGKVYNWLNNKLLIK